MLQYHFSVMVAEAAAGTGIAGATASHVGVQQIQVCNSRRGTRLNYNSRFGAKQFWTTTNLAPASAQAIGPVFQDQGPVDSAIGSPATAIIEQQAIATDSAQDSSTNMSQNIDSERF